MIPSYPFGVRYQFHGVGQGLFASGVLGDIGFAYWMNDPPAVVGFEWVYDCGSTSQREYLEDCVEGYGEQRDSSRPIDLLAISHFDADHVNGLMMLLRNAKVDVLLLPWVPLGVRVFIALNEGAALEDSLMRFLLDPVAFLRSADIPGVERIVFVPASTGEGPPADPRETEPPDSPEMVGDSNDRYRLELDYGEVPADAHNEGYAQAAPQKSANGVHFLAEGGALRVGNYWEFVPYNDAAISWTPDAAFVDWASEGGKRLLEAGSDVDRKSELATLKQGYEKAFGNSSKARNEISLFLYCGPTFNDRYWRLRLDARSPTRSAHHEIDSGREPGMLYTGDGYLNSPPKLQRVCDYLSASRVGRIATLQVMHHGSRNNWHSGVAAQVDPLLSVFSSNPGHRKMRHPHLEVLRDFWMYGPVQVCQGQDAVIHAWAF